MSEDFEIKVPMDIDELHLIKPERKVVQCITDTCELCKKTYDIPIVEYTGAYFMQLPKFNSVHLTMNVSENVDQYSIYRTNICLTCAESIINHIASLEVNLNE